MIASRARGGELNDLLATLDDECDRRGVPSISIAVIEKGDLLLAARGRARADRDQPVNPDTLYQAASISKTFAALTGLMLARGGRISLDDDVLRYLKRWRPPASDPIKDRPVTLRRLFGMTSGANVPGFPGYAVGTPLPDEVEVLRGVPPCNTPPIHIMRPPGTGRTYSGGGYQIAQLAIEDALGDQFVGLCSTLVLAPLGMERAGFFQPPDPASIDNFAEAHDDGGRHLEGGWHVYPELAAAGLWARPRDIVQVGAAMITASRGETGPVMDPRGLAEVLTSVDGFGYGLGMALANADGHRAAFKRGSNLGYRCVFTVFPESGKAGVIMTNGEGGEAVVDKALVMIGQHFGWPAIGPMKE